MRALVCLTALTHLDMGDQATANVDYEGCDMDMSDQGARALGSLVRLTHLNIGGVHLSNEGARALTSLTALTYLDLSNSAITDEG
jgi:hypothetical protein